MLNFKRKPVVAAIPVKAELPAVETVYSRVAGKISEVALLDLKEALLNEIMKDAFQDSKDKFEFYQGQAVGVNRIIQKLIVRS